ncbi:protein tilB homolog [Glossina fuscipes]|uniref:Protein tilB homolog n=1 Tax=Glossina fuscipes TaxID=7396 RepID=A0A9C5ZHE3_9MUSC|nr:protein tilB homolog [Glossina fuscipes]
MSDVNKITTLQPFEDCQKLQELYLRKNNIQDLNEIAYLQNLPNLKYLWLEENPCCDHAGANYRAIVLKALPNLKKLDNVEVTPEEVKEATKVGSNSGSGAIVSEDEPYEDAFGNNAQHHSQQQIAQHQPYDGQHQLNNHNQQQHQRQPSQATHQYHRSSQYHQRGSSSPQKEKSNLNQPHQQHPQQQPSPTTTDESVSEMNHNNNSSKASTPSQEQLHSSSPKYNSTTRENRLSYPQYDVRH